MAFKKLIYTTSLVTIVGAGLAFFLIPDRSEAAQAYCGKMAKAGSYKGDLEQYSILIRGKDEWVFRTENDFRTDFTVNQKTKNYMLTLQKALKAKNIDLVVVYPPLRGMIHGDHLSKKHKKAYGMENPDVVWDNYEAMISDLQKAGINVVGVNRDETAPDFYYKRNHHWSSVGSKITAQKVAAHIKQLPSYQNLPKEQFTSYSLEPTAYQSSFEKAYDKLCGTELPPEMITTYTTTKNVSGLTEQDLFDDVAQPKVILLGTSNSVQGSSSSNFEGFLKESLSTDVLNMAYIGAGIDTSIISFLNSDTFKKGDARVVIWEVPGYYDFNIMDDKLFQQIIPAVYGECTTNSVLTKSLTDLQGRNVVFDLKKSAKAPETAQLQVVPVDPTVLGPALSNDVSVLNKTDAKYYIKISFSEAVKERFSLKFQYHENGTKKQDFDRSDRYPHDNEFYALFPGAMSNKDLQMITLDTPPSMKNMDAQIEVCTIPDRSKMAQVVN